MNKRGQFYIIAAVIIIILIIGAVVLTNYTIKGDEKEEVKIYELTKELNLEGESVTNYGIFNERDLDSVFGQFTSDYGRYISTGEEDIYFAYGNKTSMKIIGYVKEDAGNFELSIGGSSSVLKIEKFVSGKEEKLDIVYENGPPGDEVNPNVIVDIAGKKYPFQIKKGQNFFFVIKQPSRK
ncbi:MAG: hypothetical protein QXI33_02355 [Candidatus Pacearchaeota archaeon]